MPAYNETSKQYTYKWRNANKEAYNEYMRTYMTANYDSEKRRKSYAWSVAKKEFLAILI
jgi:hypothetical protein